MAKIEISSNGLGGISASGGRVPELVMLSSVTNVREELNLSIYFILLRSSSVV